MLGQLKLPSMWVPGVPTHVGLPDRGLGSLHCLTILGLSSNPVQNVRWLDIGRNRIGEAGDAVPNRVEHIVGEPPALLQSPVHPVGKVSQPSGIRCGLLLKIQLDPLVCGVFFFHAAHTLKKIRGPGLSRHV